MLEQMKALLKKNYNINDISEETNFKTDLGLTSFDFINLIAVIEDTFGVEIEEEQYYSINTIGDLIKYIESSRS